MKLLRLTKTTILAGLLVAALALNVATVAFSSVAVLFSTAFEVVTGVASANSELRKSVAVKKKRIADLEVSVRTKSSRIASLSDELADSRAARSVMYRGERIFLSEAVENTSERVGRRVARAAVRNTGSVLAESIPLIGITVIVAVTTWELKDACDTMDDLYQLDVAFNPENAVPADRSEVCGLKVPTKEEIWQSIKDSPGAAWQAAKDLMPELPSFPEFEIPQLSWPWEWF